MFMKVKVWKILSLILDYSFCNVNCPFGLCPYSSRDDTLANGTSPGDYYAAYDS